MVLPADDTRPATSPADGYSAAQRRVIEAALDLFARHGVGGTSLQMIADALGVTKAAVYHQFKTKHEIVLAAARSELAALEAVVAAAEAHASRRRARDALVTGIVGLAVTGRRRVGSILSDPVVVAHFSHDRAFRDVMRRLGRVLGQGDGAPARVRVAMLVAAISGAATHPLVADLDDETLQAELERLARRFLGLAG